MTTKKDKWFTLFYGYFEVAVDLLSGLYILLWTSQFLLAYLPGIQFFGSPQNSAVVFMARSFGYMVLLSGLMQFAAINFGNATTRKYFLVALCTGDFMLLYLSGVFFYDFTDWTALIVFNFVFTSFLLSTRLFYLFTGVPENSRIAK